MIMLMLQMRELQPIRVSDLPRVLCCLWGIQDQQLGSLSQETTLFSTVYIAALYGSVIDN